ncbi:MAG: hypothetical protein V9E81_04265 [Marmoricola sp.]|jgi:hypothetical protein
MLWSVLTFSLITLLVLALASAVAIYVAFPRRGADLPVVPSVGNLLGRIVNRLPVLTEAEGRALSDVVDAKIGR